MVNNTENKALTREQKAAIRANAAAARRLAKKKRKIQETTGDKILLAITDVILVLVLIIIGYPVLYVVSCSFSNNSALSTGQVLLFPVGFSLDSYKFVFEYDIIWQGYRNTIFYTVCGTIMTMFCQTICAYPLSKRNYQGRGLLMAYFFTTTMIGAGMIPNLLIRSAMGLRNNVFAVLLVGLVGVSNMIILRTAFRSSIPGELYDAAAIDGANDFQTLTKIALPLVKATMSVLTLYSAVGCWNEYFTSMIYLPGRPDLWPLQLVLRPILTTAQQLAADGLSASQMQALENSGTEGVQFALIVIATVPVLVMYFVVQKYFKTGVMVGSVKG